MSEGKSKGRKSKRGNGAAKFRYSLNDFALDLPTSGFVRLPLVLKVFPVSRSGWFAGIKAGRYPQWVKIGPRVSAWRVEDIRQLIARTEAQK